jgi:hypothetical protein
MRRVHHGFQHVRASHPVAQGPENEDEDSDEDDRLNTLAVLSFVGHFGCQIPGGSSGGEGEECRGPVNDGYVPVLLYSPFRETGCKYRQ